MSTNSPSIVVVTAASRSVASEWLTNPGVARVIALRNPSASGKRLGQLAFGLGLDASLLAMLTRTQVPRRSSILATNPWIAIALRFVGYRRIASIGIFATPGSRTWAVFRRILTNCKMIVMSGVELRNWTHEGSAGRYVRYGNTFPYPSRDSSVVNERITIFIGGSSDRDFDAVDRFAAEVLASGKNIELVVAVGGAESTQIHQSAVVRRLASVSQQEFGRLLSEADICFLPLKENGKSVGHMLIVGSLQVGTPVVFTEVEGMREYEIPPFCRVVPNSHSMLDSVLQAVEGAPRRQEITEFWRKEFSRAAYLNAVVSAAHEMLNESAAHG